MRLTSDCRPSNFVLGVFANWRLMRNCWLKDSLRLPAPPEFFRTGCCSRFRKPIPPPPSKSLEEFFEPGAKSLDVYLAIPDYRQRGLNVSTGKDGGTRYLAEVAAFRDENTGTSEKPIQVARKNMRLLAESENREGSSVIRVANVERTAAGTFQLNPRFIPPLIEIGASEYLVGLLRGLVELLSARSTQLSAGRADRRIKAWRTSPPLTLRISGCFIP